MSAFAITQCLLTIVQPSIVVDDISHFDHIKLLGQLEPNCAKIIFVRSSTNILNFIFIHQNHCRHVKFLVYFVWIGWLFLHFRANGQKVHLHIYDFDYKIVVFFSRVISLFDGEILRKEHCIIQLLFYGMYYLQTWRQ